MKYVLAKASKGEGSRGGKVIGHTRSGKPIYSRGMQELKGHQHFSKEDHEDAAYVHRKLAEMHYRKIEPRDPKMSTDEMFYHKDMQKEHNHHASGHAKAGYGAFYDREQMTSLENADALDHKFEGKEIKYTPKKLEKAKKYVVGTIHTWADGRYIKENDHHWKLLQDVVHGIAKEAGAGPKDRETKLLHKMSKSALEHIKEHPNATPESLHAHLDKHDDGTYGEKDFEGLKHATKAVVSRYVKEHAMKKPEAKAEPEKKTSKIAEAMAPVTNEEAGEQKSAGHLGYGIVDGAVSEYFQRGNDVYRAPIHQAIALDTKQRHGRFFSTMAGFDSADLKLYPSPKMAEASQKKPEEKKVGPTWEQEHDEHSFYGSSKHYIHGLTKEQALALYSNAVEYMSDERKAPGTYKVYTRDPVTLMHTAEAKGIKLPENFIAHAKALDNVKQKVKREDERAKETEEKVLHPEKEEPRGTTYEEHMAEKRKTKVEHWGDTIAIQFIKSKDDMETYLGENVSALVLGLKDKIKGKLRRVPYHIYLTNKQPRQHLSDDESLYSFGVDLGTGKVLQGGLMGTGIDAGSSAGIYVHESHKMGIKIPSGNAIVNITTMPKGGWTVEIVSPDIDVTPKKQLPEEKKETKYVVAVPPKPEAKGSSEAFTVEQVPNHSKGPAEKVFYYGHQVKVMPKGEAQEFIRKTNELNKKDLQPERVNRTTSVTTHQYKIQVADKKGRSYIIHVAEEAGRPLTEDKKDYFLMEEPMVITRDWGENEPKKLVQWDQPFKMQPSGREFKLVWMRANQYESMRAHLVEVGEKKRGPTTIDV